MNRKKKKNNTDKIIKLSNKKINVKYVNIITIKLSMNVGNFIHKMICCKREINKDRIKK
jgi:hypothetical protein